MSYNTHKRHLIDHCSVLSHSAVSNSLPLHGLCSPPACSVHEDSPGKNTEVGCHVLLQGIFLTQEWNPGLPHYRQILYHLSHKGSPRILVKVKVTQLCPTLCCPWSGQLIPSPGDLPDPRIELGSPELQADSLLVQIIG